jgi:hypothetical protein
LIGLGWPDRTILEASLMRYALILSSGLLLMGAAAPSASYNIFPEQAVMNAAAVAPDGVKGVFELPVRATGRQGGWFYLNSQQDYRDPRNLTIAIPGAMADALAQRFGAELDQYLTGKTIAVRGEAKRVKIHFLADGRPTEKYYYQTHVRLTDPNLLTVEGEPVRY